MHSSQDDVRNFAKDTLPQLKDHQRQAKQLAQTLGVSAEHSDRPDEIKTSTRDSDKPRRE